MFGKYLALGAAAAMVSAVPALAQKDGGSASKAKDPNQVVCEKIEVLGSRVATKKVCMTRAEWAEKRRLERMELDRAQVNRGSCDGCQ
jgi:hypothetical protein